MMFESKRNYNIKEYTIDDIDLLAVDLVDTTWTLCQGFKINSYYLLNDSTSADGAQEYAVYKLIDGKLVKIEQQ